MAPPLRPEGPESVDTLLLPLYVELVPGSTLLVELVAVELDTEVRQFIEPLMICSV